MISFQPLRDNVRINARRNSSETSPRLTRPAGARLTRIIVVVIVVVIVTVIVVTVVIVVINRTARRAYTMAGRSRGPRIKLIASAAAVLARCTHARARTHIRTRTEKYKRARVRYDLLRRPKR